MLTSVTRLPTYEAVEQLLTVVKAQEPIVDTTFGNGVFWQNSTRTVFGGDLNPSRAKHFAADFTCLPFRDAGVPTVIFDPPFHPFVGSAEQTRFSGMGRNEYELKQGFINGVRECWRVTSGHLLVKCQGFIHNHKPQWMPLWAISVCGEPFEWLTVWRDGKRVSGRWNEQRSLYRNHADYLVFNKHGNTR